MKIRHNNAKAKENHLSIKDLPADLGKAKDELKSRIDSLGIDKNIVTKYQSQVDDLKNLKGDLKSLVERVNTDSDKLASGAHVISIKKGDEVEYLVQTEDEMLEQLKKVKETNEKIKQLNEEREKASKERKAEIDEELKKKESERQESYKYASDLVNSTADAAIKLTKGVISGDPDRMVDVVLGALAGIFSFLPKAIALGVTSVKSAWDKRKANKKLKSDDLKQLEQVQLDVVSDIAINSDPMTPEELEEVESSYSDSAFEDVGEITDWDSAFKYGYAKLKQIHGVNFDEAKAKEVLEGLKAKYPDNPKVVIGALKYGGRKRKSDEQNNSRQSNATREEYETAKNLFRELNPNETDENIEKLLDFGFGLAAKPKDLIDSLRETIAKKSRNVNSVPGEIYAVWEQMEEGNLLDVAYTGPFTSTEDAKSKLGFKYWTQEGGMKNRVTLVSKKYIPDFKFFVPVDEFIKDWNNALRGFSEVTSEIKTYLNMRKSNGSMPTSILDEVNKLKGTLGLKNVEESAEDHAVFFSYMGSDFAAVYNWNQYEVILINYGTDDNYLEAANGERLNAITVNIKNLGKAIKLLYSECRDMNSRSNSHGHRGLDKGKFLTAIHECGDGVRCSGVHKLRYLINGFLDALSEDYSEEDVIGCLKGFMHHRYGNQGGMHRGSNSMVPAKDTEVVDRYVAQANNDNYLDILKDIAKELSEHFDVRKDFGSPNEFRAWAEKNDKISDRMFIVLDYVLGAVTGMKSGVRKNSRLTNSTGYVLCAELWGDRDSRGLKSIEDYYILSEAEAESRRKELSEYKSKDDEMEFLMLYTFPETEDGYSQLLKLLKSTGNAYPGMGVNTLKESIESRRPMSLNSRSTNSIPKESGDYNIYSAKNKSGVIEDYVVGRNFDEALSEVPPFSKKNITLNLVEEGYSANYADQRANELRENLPELENNSRSTNSKSKLLDTISKSLPSDSSWNVEDNDGKITLSSGSRVLMIEQTDDRYFLSDEKDVIYISSDLNKVIEEVKKLS